MPWKKLSKEEQRFDLVRQMARGEHTVSELARRFRISRQTAYKWRGRFRRRRLRGLQDRSRRPLAGPARTTVNWQRRVRTLRLRRPTWGARKLRHQLARRHGPQGVPAVATLGRWLRRWGLSRGRRRRGRGPVLRRRALLQPQACHEVWTVDFKGWYRTGDGTRVEPLTVRDLKSRYGLGIVLLSSQAVAPTQQAFRRLFARHGYPQRIRCDNGAPFGGGGPTGLTRLSAWWVQLGIVVEFITPGRPCENGAHEQFHRVYKAEAVRSPARTGPEQQRRTDRWLRHYNQERPHEGLGMKTPAEVYRKNRQRRPWRRGRWQYAAGWSESRVAGNGEIRWRGRGWPIGEAFAGSRVGLRPLRGGRWRVYFGGIVVGDLYEKEVGGLRAARYAAGG